MKAARFHEVDHPLKVEDVPVPKPDSNEIVIDVAACGLCGSDLSIIKGYFPTSHVPLTLGHEVSGTITQVGEEVEKFHVGERVIINWLGEPCGSCPACLRGQGNQCLNVNIIGLDIDGGYAEYIKVPEGVVIPLLDDLPLEASSIIADAVTTPYHAITEVAKIRDRDIVAIVGVGGLGINAVQIAANFCSRVIAVDLVDWKLEAAEKLGATDIVNARDKDVVERVRELTNGDGVDIVLDFTGSSSALEDSFWFVRDGGQIVVTGLSPSILELNLVSLVRKEVQIKGSYGYTCEEVKQVMKMVDRGQVELDPIITHRLPLKDVNKGFDLLREGNTLRTLIIP